MDSARCSCMRAPVLVNTSCPIHGDCSPHPRIPYALTETDKVFLRTMRIDPYDSVTIQQVRQADEDRFKRE